MCSECGATHDRDHQCSEEHPVRGEVPPVRQRKRVVFFSRADGPGKVPMQVAEKRAGKGGMSTGTFAVPMDQA
jgi:hypothetical protein